MADTCDQGQAYLQFTYPQYMPVSFSPFLSVMQCHAPPHVEHATYSYHESSTFSAGIFVNYTCEPGYTLIGEATLYCTESGTWNLPAPRCEGNLLIC